MYVYPWPPPLPPPAMRKINLVFSIRCFPLASAASCNVAALLRRPTVGGLRDGKMPRPCVWAGREKAAPHMCAGGADL